jgi:hypothetical protein
MALLDGTCMVWRGYRNFRFIYNTHASPYLRFSIDEHVFCFAFKSKDVA